MPDRTHSSFAEKSLEFEKKMLLQKIGQMSNLPTPSSSIMKVMLLLRDEDVSMPELIEAISQNQSLVARILKLINSGYYGLRKSIDSVDRAVNLLGILKVKQVVYSASIMEFFSKDEEKDWNHAYSASVLMSDIMTEYKIPAASNLPLTVLMHDIGKVILRRFTPKKYRLALTTAQAEKIPGFQAEESIIHINHAEIGGWLLERWQMTEDIYKPVMFHHMRELPEEEENFIVETALLQFVNWVDCSARQIPCPKPSEELMVQAGFEEMETDYWVNFQSDLIMEIEKRGAHIADKENEPEQKHRSTSTDKISKQAVAAGLSGETQGETDKIRKPQPAAPPAVPPQKQAAPPRIQPQTAPGPQAAPVPQAPAKTESRVQTEIREQKLERESVQEEKSDTSTKKIDVRPLKRKVFEPRKKKTGILSAIISFFKK